MIFTAQSLKSVCESQSGSFNDTEMIESLRTENGEKHNENATTTFSNAVCAYISTNPFLKSCKPGLSKMYELTLKIFNV